MTRILSTGETSLDETMREMGRRARSASQRLTQLTAAQRTEGLLAMADALSSAERIILDANARDVKAGREKGLSDAMLDRLMLNADRIHAIANAVRKIAALPDPVGDEIARWTVPSGLDIARIRTPLGVVGIIYESRPNVTADAAALCLRSGNACILRCGSESLQSSLAIAMALRSGLQSVGVVADAIQLVETTDRDAVGHMLAGLDGNLDVLVPRGGKNLVARVQKDARVPVIGHLEGLCHAYVDVDADPEKTVNIVFNAKMRRTGVCGALETLLINKSVARQLLPAIAATLRDAGCELRGDEAAREILPDMTPAQPSDWQTEYLAPILAVRIVDGLDEAMEHIARYGTGHTELIITENKTSAERFLAGVDASIVLHNASTQFADGGEFGMGAEIGIATGRIHARGPVGAEQLTIFKYVVRGNGQIRP
ncbi:glutamate-5-semialdehyde dehydrogenase [Henriciella litoralis]|uniref:glutamate-5-semialdehyde dehydrogenase n=1 Tax=Henriciella litoralis TaxID=568102 RepID=UPI0009FF8201|nr:glutamate-5-semialdehyde dehydrogenase [Henriciella litoralis]